MKNSKSKSDNISLGVNATCIKYLREDINFRNNIRT